MDLYRRSSLLLFFFRSIFSLSMLQCPITYEYHWYYEYFFFFFYKFLRFQRYILDSYTSWRIIISYLLLYPRRKCASNIGRFAIQIQHTHSLRYPISFSWTTKGPTSARSFFSLTFSISPPLTPFAGDTVSNLACSSRTLLRSSIPARLPRFLSYPFSLIWKKANSCGRERRRGM